MKCNICEFRCDIQESGCGICGMYENKNGQIVERFKNAYLFINPISIETQPMLHFFPNHKFLQLGSIGCNFKCEGCVSNVFVKHAEVFKNALKILSAEEIIQKALRENSKGIVFGINEPTMQYFSLLDLAKKAKESKLLFGISTNLYYTKGALEELMKYLDFVNVGLKGYTQTTYKKFCKALDSKPVFRNIVYLFKNNVYFEVSIPHVKGNEIELINVAKFLSKLSHHIPMQVMRFVPFDNASAELEPSISESEELVEKLKRYLDYVYLFNSPGTKYLNTTLDEFSIKRYFYGPMGAHIASATGKPTHIVGNICKKNFEEDGFFGGYRLTRAIEMVVGILNALGVKDKKTITFVIGTILRDRDFLAFFHETQDGENTNLENYFDVVNLLAKISNTDSSKLVNFYSEVLEDVKQKRKNVDKKLKSYYVMGTPIFALNTHRFENKLASFVGLETIKLTKEGKPGVNITHEELIAYNPDIVFISGFISCKEEDFYAYCQTHNININAIKTKKVFRLPFGWDFGTVEWIFGLMFIANAAYPDIYSFDIENKYYLFKNKSYTNTNKSFYANIV
ncbi:MAG TPA: radical SAM protein [Desulfurella acetivorans]|uniref:Radical SAM protein n=1 Tax=Desulfurella acetivorans TaxID=33002 RepID=A0A7C6A801_DESAE|nr:radical SAM protein [Desulfurella acetivorans]